MKSTPGQRGRGGGEEGIWKAWDPTFVLKEPPISPRFLGAVYAQRIPASSKASVSSHARSQRPTGSPGGLGAQPDGAVMGEGRRDEKKAGRRPRKHPALLP